MAQGKTNSEIKAENKALRERISLLRKHGFGQSLARVLEAAIRWGAMALMVFYGSTMVVQIKGTTTTANIQMRGDLSVSAGANGPTDDDHGNLEQWVIFGSMLFGIGGILYGRAQRNLRRQVIQQFHPYQKMAELKVDPRRTSSQLTTTGETRPGDI